MKPFENQRHELWRRLRFQHGIQVTTNAMATIEQFFHQSIKTSIYHVGMYRAINVVFCVLFLTGWIFLEGTPAIRFVVPGMMIMFLIYNVIHLLVNWVNYKNIKEPETVDPEMYFNPEPESNVHVQSN